MPAIQEERIENIKRLGIVAGSGKLPEKLLHACDHRGIEAFIVALEGQADPSLVQGRNHMWSRIGALGQILKTLKAHEIQDLVLIGALRRPSVMELMPDLKAAEFFAKIGIRAMGDNNLLSHLRELLEREGFSLHGIHQFADELLARPGVIGKHKPGKADWPDIRRGLEISQNLGSLDVGQSVIVQEGIVLGVEAAEGTDELMRRCKHLHRKGRPGILIKTCKPQQDRDLDLPAIGPQTVILAAECNLGGVVIHAGHTLIIDEDEVMDLAGRHKIFVIAVDPAAELAEDRHE